MNTETAFHLLDHRVLSYYREALELRKGAICRPRFALLYPTYACNHNCTGCDYTELNNPRQTAMLTGQPFRHILEEVAGFGIRAVEFCGGGEPLLHPEIDSAVHYLREAGIRIGLLTNGTNIPEYRAALLTQACLYIRVSLDAGTEEVFNRVKRPRSTSAGFNHVVENVRRLLRYRKQQASVCQISLKYTIDRNNTDDLENAIRVAEELGVDSIQFKCARNVPTEITSEQKQALNLTLQELQSPHGSVPIVGNLLPRPLVVPCWLSPLHVMIDPLGEVFLCCYYRHRIDRHKYGNVLNRSLQELWYSAEHQAALRGIRNEECEKYDCRFIRYSEMMANAIDVGNLDFI
jgi:MoaA/NifB/PqqE/SkfB family radical SAM enzyme